MSHSWGLPQIDAERVAAHPRAPILIAHATALASWSSASRAREEVPIAALPASHRIGSDSGSVTEASAKDGYFVVTAPIERPAHTILRVDAAYAFESGRANLCDVWSDVPGMAPEGKPGWAGAMVLRLGTLDALASADPQLVSTAGPGGTKSS
jgi:hypothetical protein